jgi:hypothetical protein
MKTIIRLLSLALVVTIDASSPVRIFTTYGTTWGRPQSVLDARFAKISAQIDF